MEKNQFKKQSIEYRFEPQKISNTKKAPLNLTVIAQHSPQNQTIDFRLEINFANTVRDRANIVILVTLHWF